MQPSSAVTGAVLTLTGWDASAVNAPAMMRIHSPADAKTNNLPGIVQDSGEIYTCVPLV